MSQTTTNLIASCLNVHPRLLMPVDQYTLYHQQQSVYRPASINSNQSTCSQSAAPMVTTSLPSSPCYQPPMVVDMQSVSVSQPISQCSQTVTQCSQQPFSQDCLSVTPTTAPLPDLSREQFLWDEFSLADASGPVDQSTSYNSQVFCNSF